MDWFILSGEEQLVEIKKRSFDPDVKGVVLFKHSTRCSISMMAKNRLERYGDLGVPAYYLDLLQYRGLSDAIAGEYGIEHQSPQVLVIKDGKCKYAASHSDIDFNSLREALNT